MKYYDKRLLQKNKPVIRRIEQMHPHKMLNYLIIVGSSIVYMFLIISFLQKFYLHTNHFSEIQIPKFFTVSTLILVASLLFTVNISRAYHEDRLKDLRIMLSLVLIAGLLFFIAQSIAWLELLSQHTDSKNGEIIYYLYLFSGIHLIHIVAALVFVGILFYRIASVEGDPIKSIILLTNPYEKIKLEMFSHLWHYIVASWTLLFFLFLFLF